LALGLDPRRIPLLLQFATQTEHTDKREQDSLRNDNHWIVGMEEGGKAALFLFSHQPAANSKWNTRNPRRKP
jgi:hypothetical protein